MSNYSFIAEKSDVGIRLDKWLSEQDEVDITRSAAIKIIESGGVKVNGFTAKKSYTLSDGDIISVEIPEPILPEAVPQNIPIDVVYEDGDLAVVNKPQGMVVHPAAGNPDGTLVNALMYRFEGSLSGINGVIRPGIVHRIDKNTSGLLVIAKNDFAHLKLAELIKAHDFTREYEAICVGHFKEPTGTINAPIGRDKKDRKRMAVTLVNALMYRFEGSLSGINVVIRPGSFAATHICALSLKQAELTRSGFTRLMSATRFSAMRSTGSPTKAVKVNAFTQRSLALSTREAGSTSNSPPSFPNISPKF